MKRRIVPKCSRKQRQTVFSKPMSWRNQIVHDSSGKKKCTLLLGFKTTARVSEIITSLLNRYAQRHIAYFLFLTTVS